MVRNDLLKNIAIALFVLLNVGLILYFKYHRLDSTASDFVSQMMAYDYREIIKYDQQRILPDTLDIEDSECKSWSLDSISRAKTLVIRYSSLNCNSCVDTLMHYARIFADSVPDGRICVFADYENDRDFHLLSRLNKSKVSILQVKDRLLSLDDKGVPYMFVVNQDKSVSHLFIPHKEYPNLIRWYYSVVVPYINN